MDLVKQGEKGMVRCRFWMVCDKYQSTNVTCERDGGMYEKGKGAGCYRLIEESTRRLVRPSDDESSGEANQTG